MYDSHDDSVLTKRQNNTIKSVYLTFDDGPSKVLPDLLDILKKENTPATFFWQSRLLYSERPWKRVINEGHKIGTHSTKHKRLTKLAYTEQLQDLAKSVELIEKVTKEKVTYFRPPFGCYNEDTIKAAKKLGLIPVLWRIGSMDWELKENPEKIITNVTDHLEDGAIILLHELEQTRDILSDLIRKIKSNGYVITNL